MSYKPNEHQFGEDYNFPRTEKNTTGLSVNTATSQDRTTLCYQ